MRINLEEVRRQLMRDAQSHHDRAEAVGNEPVYTPIWITHMTAAHILLDLATALNKGLIDDAT